MGKYLLIGGVLFYLFMKKKKREDTELAFVEDNQIVELEEIQNRLYDWLKASNDYENEDDIFNLIEDLTTNINPIDTSTDVDSGTIPD